MYIEGAIFVQSTEMEEKFGACIYKNNVFPFFSLYAYNASNVKSAHTHVNFGLGI